MLLCLRRPFTRDNYSDNRQDGRGVMQNRLGRREFARAHVEQLLVVIGVFGVLLAVIVAVWTRA